MASASNKPRRTQAVRRIASQVGGALIVGLVTLLVMTVIGAAAVQTTALEEKMAGNARSRDLAFQAAESALRQGERWLRNQALAYPGGEVPCTGTPADGLDGSGCYASNIQATPVWKLIDNADAWNDPARATPYAGSLAQITQPPSYIVEKLQFVDDPGNAGLTAGTPPVQNHYYRITAHGNGGTPDAIAIVQSTYKTSH
ncbi:type IV pilus assembly protein PilX [Methylomagnum ishizawai]|uniref:Type IV pilus assembly protein PilX n=1 Tax=Methylomagnum ishizawai TaxID=1760988 RepID=A0A1Y6CT84_9GAMM|nr:type IV pilus assembly protein PilX [Methylomagnum ishizawai]